MNALLAFALLALTAVRGEVVNIKTAQDLILFSNNVNAGVNKDATVYLQNDIDFTGVSDQFQPVGSRYEHYFSGVFDGQGHTISHLVLDKMAFWYFGLFGTSYGATVRNVIMDRTCSFVGRSLTNKTCTTEPYSITIGGIFGRCMTIHSECLIENNVFMGKLAFVGVTPRTTSVHMGGIVGQSYGWGHTTTVRNCANYGTITFSGRADSTHMGGVAGSISMHTTSPKGSVVLHNCLNYGRVQHLGTTNKTLNVGGVFGANFDGYDDLDSLVNLGSVAVNARTGDRKECVGSLAGALYGVALTHSYWVNGTGHPAAGLFSGSTLEQSSSFDGKSFTLDTPVRVGEYAGTSLVKALNAGAGLNATRKYSQWLLNRNSKAVTFAVNGETPFFKIDSQVVLMPTLADGVEKKFDGWYTDAGCTKELTNFEVVEDVILYEKWI